MGQSRPGSNDNVGVLPTLQISRTGASFGVVVHRYQYLCVYMYIDVYKCINAVCDKMRDEEIAHWPTHHQPGYSVGQIGWNWSDLMTLNKHEATRKKRSKKNPQEITTHFLFLMWCEMIQKILEVSTNPAKTFKNWSWLAVTR